MEITLLIVALVALLIGGGIGWFAGSRPIAEWKARHGAAEARAAEADERVKAMAPELATMSERAARADDLAVRLDAARDEREELRAELAKLKANAANFDEQMKQMREARTDMLKEFENAGHSVLTKAQDAFLERASERFGHSEKASAEKLQALLKPVDERLKAYEIQVKEIEAERRKEYGNISSLMEQVRLGQEAVKSEATNIVNSLRSGPKTSGRWGEQQFENLLDIAGLSKFTDYRSEVSTQTADGPLRPDYVINLPGDRQLIVDIKCPINSYLKAIEAKDQSERDAAFVSYGRAVRNHAKALSQKAYWSQFDRAPDFVILYIPGDNFLSAALEHQPEMWSEAAENRVVISGPATFFPLARTLAAMWEHEQLTDRAQEIISLGKDLHHNLALMTERISKLGDNIEKTAKSYNEFVTSADGKVVLGAKKLESMNLVKSDKKISDLAPIDTEMRSLKRLSTDSEG